MHPRSQCALLRQTCGHVTHLVGAWEWVGGAHLGSVLLGSAPGEDCRLWVPLASYPSSGDPELCSPVVITGASMPQSTELLKVRVHLCHLFPSHNVIVPPALEIPAEQRENQTDRVLSPVSLSVGGKTPRPRSCGRTDRSATLWQQLCL